ncbi:MAG: sugar transferase [Bacteroidota bacterium]
MNTSANPSTRPSIELLYYGESYASFLPELINMGFACNWVKESAEINKILQEDTDPEPSQPVKPILFEPENLSKGKWQELVQHVEQQSTEGKPLFLLAHNINSQRVKSFLNSPQPIEVIEQPFSGQKIGTKIQRWLEVKEPKREMNRTTAPLKGKIPLGKRLFDIAVAGSILLALSPFLLLVILAIKLESKGPIFYISKRVGTGYKVFNFYKFRSMRVNADKMLDKVKHLNNYQEAHQEHKKKPKRNLSSPVLIGDDTVLTEEIHAWNEEQDGSTFLKIKNDPRITRIGKFIRNTSIDELPQLLNVLKGDMSIVGNRPLPLYEAEQLTTDDYIERFMAPAGITGLWQVTDRGKADAEEDSRKMLDIEYARHYSMWMDLKILLMTLPALLQQDDV